MEGSYISHHSAFEYYGFANQVYYDVYVSGEKRFYSFEYDGIYYRYIAPRIKPGVDKKLDGIYVTDLERTVIDSINDFEKIGGIEELLRCLSLIPYINESKALQYLEAYNKQFLYQKAGYILEHFQNNLRLTNDFFDQCRKGLNGSVRYLYHGIGDEAHIYNQPWKMVVPTDLTAKLEKGVTVDADF